MNTAFPLGTTERLFATLHRRFLDRHYPAPPWDRLDPAALPPADVEIARQAWAARAVAEYRSMIVFGELIARFAELRLPLEVTTAASRLLQDEARHTELCARAADALGGNHGATLAPSDLQLPRNGLPAHLFVARWTASMFCVGESASVGILDVLQQHTTDPCLQVVVGTLLRDEILHDRFGWALARLVFPRLTDDERDWLAADLAFSLAHYDRIHAGASRADGEPLPEAPPPAGPNLGIPSRPAAARAFYDRIDRVILPSLAALGVPAYEAWALRLEVPAQAENR
ncbi:hypothetical protein WME97_29120 [Sorangium sp. So ce367]|uniref:hypothetical protein n=1 Tax=Sorangium sp. So ce367 TaxID=3133305 RepID=UPI003F609C2A